MTTRVDLSSPAEPSGASWLINCLLELGIKVSHKPVVDNVWRHAEPTPPPDHMCRTAADGSCRLHPKAQVLKKWLPVLSSIESFFFRDDIEVEHVQDLPTPRHVGHRIRRRLDSLAYVARGRGWDTAEHISRLRERFAEDLNTSSGTSRRERTPIGSSPWGIRS